MNARSLDREIFLRLNALQRPLICHTKSSKYWKKGTRNLSEQTIKFRLVHPELHETELRVKRMEKE